MEFRQFVVERIEQESRTIKSFYLKREDGLDAEGYLPGQHVVIKIQPTDDEKEIIRNYTLSDSPGKNYFRLTIKREELGKSSRFFHDKVKEGDIVQVSEPAGKFFLNENNRKPIVLLSGGVGITPMMSMIEYLSINQSDRKIYFLHSSLNKAVQPMTDRLRELDTSMPNMKLVINHSKPLDDEVKNSDYDFDGFIGIAHLENLIKETDLEWYLCGPVPFMEAMYTHVIQLGHSSESIFYEFFGEGKPLGNQKPKFKDSSTLADVAVSFSKSGKDVLWNDKYLSILELAEDHGLTPEFSCRMGTCSTCESALVSGEVKYDPEPFIDLEPGKVLICCSQPTTDVTIEI